jgi:segregation and condensation protein A
MLLALEDNQYSDFAGLFDPTEGRMGVVVTFLAILELVKESLIDIVQAEPFGPIHVRSARAQTAGNVDGNSGQEQSGN